MAIYSSVLAWEVPWTEELGGLQSIGARGGHCVRFEAGERPDKTQKDWLAFRHLTGPLA